ncbi:hypothetical protein HB771_05610 (plasmid) [Rhizobium leguminosarum bv. viciae]|nr:hypothetical protein HB771_05610 [Rhizobium leguminosarum bv. viciae]
MPTIKLKIAIARSDDEDDGISASIQCGFVLTHDRLDDLVPIDPASMADRQVIEWDKIC